MRSCELSTPDFQLVEHLQAKGPEVLKAAIGQADWQGALDRLKNDAVGAMHDLPAMLTSRTRRMSQEGEGLGRSLHMHGLGDLEEHRDRSSNRLSLALVILGLYTPARCSCNTASDLVFTATCQRWQRSPMRWRSGSPFAWPVASVDRDGSDPLPRVIGSARQTRTAACRST